MRKNKISKVLSIIFLVIIISVSFIACKSKDAAKDVNATKEPFTLKVATSTSFDDITIGDELGYFKEEGIQIQYTGIIKAGVSSIQTVLGGENDVFTGHPNQIAKAVIAGAKVKAVATGIEDNEKFNHMNYIVKSDGPIQSAKDLLNKKVKVGVAATNSCQDLIAIEWAKQNNIPLENLEFILMPDTQQEQSLKQGLIDIANLHPAYYKKAYNDGGVKLLFSSYEVVKTAAGGSSISGFSEKFIKEHPEVVQAYIRVINKTNKWINSHQDEAIKITANKLGFKPEDVAAFWFSEYPGVKESDVQFWIDLMVKNNIIKDGDIKATDLFTNEYSTLLKK